MSDGKFPFVTRIHVYPAWTGCEQTFNLKQRLAWNFLNDNSECPQYTLEVHRISIQFTSNLLIFGSNRGD